MQQSMARLVLDVRTRDREGVQVASQVSLSAARRHSSVQRMRHATWRAEGIIQNLLFGEACLIPG